MVHRTAKHETKPEIKKLEKRFHGHYPEAIKARFGTKCFKP
jgi:hypothetical protein